MLRILRAAVVLLVSCTGPALGRTWYVHPDSALSSIQAGLDSSAAGDTVLVGPGTYAGAGSWPQVAGITVRSELGPAATVVGSGYPSYGFTLFYVPGRATISGFSIDSCYNDPGGGVYASNCTLDIYNCDIDACGSRLGGGVYCEYGKYTVRNCRVTNCETILYSPGGIGFGINCLALVESCTVTDNWGGGIEFSYGESTVVRHCNIMGNRGVGVGNGGQAWNTDARYNWWGDASGPYHPTLNPSGRGDTVSDYVDFDPWLTGPVGVDETPDASRLTQNAGASILHGASGVARDASCVVYDITGRRVIEPKTGAYFVRESATSSVRKVVITR